MFKIFKYTLEGLTFLLIIGLLSGCTSPTGGSQDPGRLYVLNNAQPPRPGHHGYVTWVKAKYEGMTYEIPFHLTNNGELTGNGAFELTDEPLPGGTKAHVKIIYNHQAGRVGSREITVTIDGSRTIEVYMERWGGEGKHWGSTVLVRERPGKWEGITIRK